jgi:hypothetical protein
MSTCLARPEQIRQPVVLNVAFAPLPRAKGERQQVFMPDWIVVPPHELQQMWKDTHPDRLQDCLQRTRSLPLEVPLPGDSQTHGLPVFVESVRLQL